MTTARRALLIAGLVLGGVLLVWRAPHVADDIRYALATPWPGAELELAEDGTVELGGRRIAVSAGMGVDCMPGPAPIPLPECRDPGFGARLSAKSPVPGPELPRLVHARVESEGETWETDLFDVERERYYDATFQTQYAGAGAQRKTPSWPAGRSIQITIWLEFEGRLYRVALPPTVISRSS